MNVDIHRCSSASPGRFSRDSFGTEGTMARWNDIFRWERCVGSVLLAVLFLVSRVTSEDNPSLMSQTAAMVSVPTTLCILSGETS